MAKLLYIEASPRKQRSHSIAVAQSFLRAYSIAHPSDVIETWDLWDTELPDFTGDIIDIRYAIASGQSQDDKSAKVWHQVVEVFRRFASTDKYLFSIPMWNFGIPYKLKHFIDTITQPNFAFHFSPSTSYRGSITGKPVAVIYTRGGQYSPGSNTEPLDFQKPYIETWLKFIGFMDLRSVVFECTNGDPPKVAQAKVTALNQAAILAKDF
jgi:FMN-dependent NADH-azoreductase